jgi:hypothetical protein
VDKINSRCILCPVSKPTLCSNDNTTNKWTHLKKYHFVEYSKAKELDKIDKSGSAQVPLENFGLKPKAYGQADAQIRHEILKLICRDLQPISIVEDSGFMSFIQFAFPAYKIPARSTFTLDLEKLYKSVKQRIMGELSDLTHLSITTDGWTSKYTQDHFVSVTVHYVDKETKPISTVIAMICLDKAAHTAQNIANAIEAILVEWQIKSMMIYFK